jgi:hypothetical protein
MMMMRLPRTQYGVRRRHTTLKRDRYHWTLHRLQWTSIQGQINTFGSSMIPFRYQRVEEKGLGEHTCEVCKNANRRVQPVLPTNRWDRSSTT